MRVSRITGALLAAMVGAAATTWAGKPWESKPYTEWTQGEVKQVLEDSPWARSVVFQGNLLVDTPDVPVGGPRLTVRWESALSVRQAMVRREELAGRSLDQQAVAQYLSTPPPSYVIVVFGSPLASRSFRHLTDVVVRESSYLQLRGSKQKIVPSSVRLIRQGSELFGLEFQFPREIEGKPTIGDDEKGVIFYCGLGSGWITTDFNPSKMVRDGKPDL